MATRLIFRPPQSFIVKPKSQTKFIAPNNYLTAANQQGAVRYAGGGLKEVRRRLGAIKMIGKITKTMKMIATSRTKAAQKRIVGMRPFFGSATSILTHFPPQTTVKKTLFFPVCSDRGLCGAINSGIGKLVKSAVREAQGKGEEVKIVPVGDKGNTIFVKETGPNVLFQAGGTSKSPFNFMGVSWIVDRALSQTRDADKYVISYNKFVSAVSFEPKSLSVIGFNSIKDSGEVFTEFEFEEDATMYHLEDLIEFQVASLMYGAVMENYGSELAARTQAMDSATRNANELLKKLTTKYNRVRQAAITTELTEIISGKAAIEDM